MGDKKVDHGGREYSGGYLGLGKERGMRGNRKIGNEYKNTVT